MAPLSPCSLCSAPCCKDYLITVTSSDVKRIAEGTGKNPEEFSVLNKANLLNQDKRTVLECREGEFVLALKSHPCWFLEKNRCSIFRIAPLVCRLYPWTDMNKRVKIPLCPILGSLGFRIIGADQKLAKKYSEQFQSYCKQVSEWNRKKGSREECWRFLSRGCQTARAHHPSQTGGM